ncbi:hypothetical protein T484DRAFT_1763960 [Baffinella frigidus]|nr:hypothetical protein T484DRAFT_1763960 [Cryptophyta sp. CCMP2293]
MKPAGIPGEVRNRVSTFLRLFASLFFILLIFLVNEGIKSRTASLSSFKDLPTPPRNVISGIPECSVARGLSMCYTFGYIPAPYDQYVPETTYSHLSDWIREVDLSAKAAAGWCVKTDTPATRCADADCADGTSSPSCTECCAMWRTHTVVRAIMTNNGTKDEKVPIPPTKVFGWPNEANADKDVANADKYILGNPQASLLCTPYAVFVNNVYTM